MTLPRQLSEPPFLSSMSLPKILLLDCSKKLLGKLKAEGFNVSSGTIGFASGARQLPHQLYESQVIIYNPKAFARRPDGDYMNSYFIKDETSQFSLQTLSAHMDRGATLLVFANNIADDIDALNQAYNWIGFMPVMQETHDQQIYLRTGTAAYATLNPILILDEVKNPVLIKLESTTLSRYPHEPIFTNGNRETLGAFVFWGRSGGKLIILPEFKDNDSVIEEFLNRILPLFHPDETKKDVVSDFNSPQEIETQEALGGAIEEAKRTEVRVIEIRKVVEQERRKKIQVIKAEETAALILKYYNLALQQEEVSLFYLYKVTEALQKKFGGETKAKELLGNRKEWNLIGTLANATYADIRHAPKPGEKIKEYSQKEIKECFEAAKKIVHSYFKTLF